MASPDGEASNFYQRLGEHAQRDRLAVLASGCDPLSYGELVCLIENIWASLNEAGIGHGSRVAVALPSGLEALLTTVAIAAHGTCVPLNPHLSRGELAAELSRLRLDGLIVPGWLNSQAKTVAQDGPYRLIEAPQIATSPSNFRLRCVRATRHAGASEASSNSTLMILRTSATTGPSKLVPVTYGNMIDLAAKMEHWFGLTADDRAACVLSTYYAAGSKLNVLVPLLLGESIAIPRMARIERLVDWLGDLQPRWFSAGPTLLQAILDELRSGGAQPPKGILRFITSGSAHLPDPVRSELEDILDCPILELYGISEAGVMAANPAPPATRKEGTVGLVPAGELVVRDQTGAAAAPGEIGEIFVGGPAVMPGYLDEAEAIGTGLQDGWLQTGDLGFIDRDGFLTLIGRTNEVINRGGEKVSPNDIEQALLLHPAVREAAAFGVAHPRLGQNVAAAVVLAQGATATPVELRKFLRTRLAPFKVPQRIDIVSSLPKSRTGKVLRAQLVELAAHREHRADPPQHPLEFPILEVWQRLLQRRDVGIHDDFFEAGGDSLLATQMLLEIEPLAGRRVSESELMHASTIRQLATILVADAAENDQPITKVKDGAGTPFFFCHGDYETRGFYALKLAALLDADQPVYLIQPPRDVAGTSTLVIEDMARTLLAHLLASHPSGDFRLGGFCNGGLLAWELAHQLRGAGREVEALVLVDTLSLNSRPVFRRLGRLARAIASVSRSKSVERTLARELMPAMWNWTRGSGGRTRKWVALAAQSFDRHVARANGAAQPFRLPTDRRNVHHYKAMANYLPPRLDCDVIAIACEQNADAFDWSTEPWTRLAPRVRHAVVPGEHKTCITVHVEALARLLNRARRTAPGPA